VRLTSTAHTDGSQNLRRVWDSGGRLLQQEGHPFHTVT